MVWDTVGGEEWVKDGGEKSRGVRTHTSPSHPPIHPSTLLAPPVLLGSLSLSGDKLHRSSIEGDGYHLGVSWESLTCYNLGQNTKKK